MKAIVLLTLMVLLAGLNLSCAQPAEGDPADLTEPDLDSKADTTTYQVNHGDLEFGMPFTAEIMKAKEYHNWTFAISRPIEIEIATSRPSGSAKDVDTYLYLYKQTSKGTWGTAIAKNDDVVAGNKKVGANIWSSLKKSLTNGRYQVVVKGYSTKTRGKFAVKVDCAGCLDPRAQNRADRDCHIALVGAQLTADLQGDFEVLATDLEQGATPNVIYGADPDYNWQDAPTLTEVAGAPAGYQRFHFSFSAVPAGKLRFVPVLEQDGIRLFDHNQGADDYSLEPTSSTLQLDERCSNRLVDAADVNCKIVLVNAAFGACAADLCKVEGDLEVQSALVTQGAEPDVLYGADPGFIWQTAPVLTKTGGAPAKFQRYHFVFEGVPSGKIELIPFCILGRDRLWDHNRIDGNYSLDAATPIVPDVKYQACAAKAP